MEERILSQKALDILLKSQADEETDSLIYDFLSKKEKNPKNKNILEKSFYDIRYSSTKIIINHSSVKCLLGEITNCNVCVFTQMHFFFIYAIIRSVN